MPSIVFGPGAAQLANNTVVNNTESSFIAKSRVSLSLPTKLAQLTLRGTSRRFRSHLGGFLRTWRSFCANLRNLCTKRRRFQHWQSPRTRETALPFQDAWFLGPNYGRGYRTSCESGKKYRNNRRRHRHQAKNHPNRSKMRNNWQLPYGYAPFLAEDRSVNRLRRPLPTPKRQL